jgi:hypothetical protein
MIRRRNGAFGGMIIVRETEILGENLPQIPLCRIPGELIWD